MKRYVAARVSSTLNSGFDLLLVFYSNRHIALKYSVFEPQALDRQTDGQTDGRVAALLIASHGRRHSNPKQ